MKAILYEIYVADSAIDSAHGIIYKMKEIFIKDYNISINSKFIYKTNRDRYKHAKKIGVVNMPNKIADIFKIYLQSQKVAMDMGSDLLNMYFPETKKRISVVKEEDVLGKEFTKKVRKK